MAAIMAYRKAWLKVPTGYRIEVDGNLGAQVYSKDVFLHLCGRIAARVLAGQEGGCGSPGWLCNPASRSVLLQAISEGVIATLVEAGAAVCAARMRILYRADGCARRWGEGALGAEQELLREDGGITALRYICLRSRLPR